MKKIWCLDAVLSLVLFLSFGVVFAQSEPLLPESVPGLSATALPDISKLSCREFPTELIVMECLYPVTSHVVVGFTVAMPWNPDKVVLYEWRIPVVADENPKVKRWKYFAAFDSSTVTALKGKLADARIDHDGEDNITSVTLIISGADGKEYTRTFRPSQPEKK